METIAAIIGIPICIAVVVFLIWFIVQLIKQSNEDGSLPIIAIFILILIIAFLL